MIKMIEIMNITKYYGKFKVLENVTFSVNDNEIVGFVGVNGAGKTTTMKIAVGLVRPTSGTVLIDGHDILKEKEKASMTIGWVSESPSFEPDFKVYDYLKYIAGYYGINGNEANEKINDVMDETNILEFKNRKIRELSYGNKKRLALAIALLHDPKNLLFDEVLNGLDPEGIAFFRELIIKHKKEGKAILFSSHILSEVESIVDKVVFIHKGKIVSEKTIEDIRKEVNPNAVILRVKNVDKGLLEILSKFGRVSLVKNNEIIIDNIVTEPDEIVSKIVKDGYKIIEITSQKRYLETYFLKLIGDNSEP
jgi:ABC-2 type transport system ATP-binding protein